MEYPIFAWANLWLFSQYSNILIGWLHNKEDGRVVTNRSSCTSDFPGRGGGGVDCPVVEYTIFAWANLRLFSQYSNILIGWLHTKEDGIVVTYRSSCTSDFLWGEVDCPVMEYPIFAWANLRLFSQYSNILIGWLHTKEDGRVVTDRSSCTSDFSG